MKNILEHSLPKWPLLLVDGEPVTPDQASEIIIRTSNMIFNTNDKVFLKQIYASAGISMESTYLAHWQDQKAAMQKYRCLQIEYLRNNSRVVSSYVGGPHGWCNWDGKIFCDNYAIGKWPSGKAIFEEWQKIAAAFPFLTLTSQLYDQEEEQVLMQFEVKNGQVTVSEPTVSMEPGVPSFNFNIGNHASERGCTIQQFKNALQICQNGILH